MNESISSTIIFGFKSHKFQSLLSIGLPNLIDIMLDIEFDFLNFFT